jgi:hypothetical protein
MVVSWAQGDLKMAGRMTGLVDHVCDLTCGALNLA